MTDTWAAKVLADVPRYDASTIMWSMDGNAVKPSTGRFATWIKYDDALAVIAKLGAGDELDYWKADSAAAWDKCEERRVAQEAAKTEAAALTAQLAERDALRAKVARLEGALDAIADPQKLRSYGDPGILRDFARAALTDGGSNG